MNHLQSSPHCIDRVVVIGSNGFMGRNLIRVLREKKIEVLALSKEELDCLDPKSIDRLSHLLKPTDSVVILATITPSKGKGIDALVKNIHIAETIGKAIEKQNVAHLVYISADAVYPLYRGVVSESTSPDPADIYGAMHLTREQIFRSLQVPIAILRSTLVYGAGDPHNSYGPNRLRRMAHKEGKITLFGKGEERRDYIFIDDVVALIIKAVEHRSQGLLNLATGTSISYFELAEKIASKFSNPIEIVTNVRTNAITHCHFDPANVFKAFPGFTFKTLDEGLELAHKNEFGN